MIYELRAYIGKTRTLYTAIYTNMAAAQNKVKTIRKNCELNGVELHGRITPLLAQGEEYEPQTDLTEWI